ncbi:MAG: HD domain-containing protein [Clostridiales bacterium]|nr:HD domain-containing protein [Clostridiales bacterium]
MQKNISDFKTGENIQGFYVISNIAVKKSRTGSDYLSATLSDQSGSVGLKAWDYSGELSADDNGSIVKVRGIVEEYKEKPQLLAARYGGSTNIRLLREDDDISDLDILPTAPINLKESYQYILKSISEINDPDYKRLCEEMLKRHAKDFIKIPAGQFVHHDFIGGLLMHSSNMLKIAEFLAELYSDFINKDLLMAATLLHDFSKIREFELSSAGLVARYSTEGMLLGHLYLGAHEVAILSEELGIDREKSMLLEHLILSHHGEPEHGAAVRPQTAEAELLSMIDLIDSRMEICRSALLDTAPQSFSDKIFGLDFRKIYRHEFDLTSEE